MQRRLSDFASHRISMTGGLASPNPNGCRWRDTAASNLSPPRIGFFVVAASILRSSLPNLIGHGTGNWFDYITHKNMPLVMRPILISRDIYLQHLKTLTTHDGSAISAQELSLFGNLPDWFWMVEFSLPALFTGNRSKLGELVIDSRTTGTGRQPFELLRLVRLPSLLFVRDAINNLSRHTSGVTSHASFYEYRPHSHQW
jgi:hypothetical protein